MKGYIRDILPLGVTISLFLLVIIAWLSYRGSVKETDAVGLELATYVILGLASVLFLAAVVIIHSREIAHRAGAQLSLKEAQSGLEDSVREHTSELAANNRSFKLDAAELRRAEEENRTLAASLEHRVAERTGALEAQVTALHDRTSLFDLAFDGILSRDMSGAVQYWSRGAEETYGWTKEEALGKITHTLLQTQFPESLTEIEEALHQRGRWEGELIQTRRDGLRINVASRCSIWNGADHSAGKVLEINRNITDRKKIEAKLQENEQRCQLMVEGVRDFAIFLLDTDGRVASWNAGAERFKGYTAEEIIGKHFSCFYPQDDIDSGKPAMELRIAAAVGRFEEEGWRIRKDGSKLWEYGIITKLEDKSGRMLGFSKVTQDFTQRKSAAKNLQSLNEDLEQRSVSLEAANKELEAFTYSVSHDLRAPLRHVDGFSRLLLEKHSSQLDEEGKRMLERVRQGTQHMGALVDDLLNLSRVSRREVSALVTDLNTILEEVLEELKPSWQGRLVEFRIGRLPFAHCDPGLIRQVFVNLLSNAIKFTRPRARAIIEVGQAQNDARSVIFVRDNGVGFKMKYADKLFGVFQRLHRAEDFEGTGVGLVTVQRIIHKHGGRVWAAAEIDMGATFYFTLEGMEGEPSGDTITAPEVTAVKG
ncbi:MAG: PAS domain S-box protein [Acidipila sp.]|nr:PAS domain S-box protein [Acidipila sp.]